MYIMTITSHVTCDIQLLHVNFAHEPFRPPFRYDVPTLHPLAADLGVVDDAGVVPLDAQHLVNTNL